MKRALVLMMIVLTANLAHAGCGIGDDDGESCHIGVVGGGVLILAAAFASCAPEVREGNIAAADRTLTTLASSPKFAQAKKFRETVTSIRQEKNATLKIKRYFDLIDVDASNQTQVVNFIGQREVPASQLNALERKADLTPEQSNAVVTALTTSLRENLQ